LKEDFFGCRVRAENASFLESGKARALGTPLAALVTVGTASCSRKMKPRNEASYLPAREGSPERKQASQPASRRRGLFHSSRRRFSSLSRWPTIRIEIHLTNRAQ
jgi:hypothetical protein